MISFNILLYIFSCFYFKTCYSATAGASYDYSHPDTWAKQFPAQCSGRFQSPIDLVSATYSSTLKPLHFTVPQTFPDFTLENTGHTLKINFPRGTFNIETKDGNFTALQYHFHWAKTINESGSEHSIANSFYAAEGHLVTQSTDNNYTLAVFGTMFEASSASDPNMDDLCSNLASITAANTTTKIPGFDITDFVSADTNQYFHYGGSLTTPNCAEGILWHVFKIPRTITEFQLKKFNTLMSASKQPIGGNYRPVQNLNGRTIYTSVICINNSIQCMVDNMNLLLFVIVGQLYLFTVL